MSDYAKLIGELYLVASQAKSNNRRKLLGRAADAIERLQNELEYTSRRYELALEDLEKAEQPGWIPVMERLPETCAPVLVCLRWGMDDYEITVGEYWGDSKASPGWGIFDPYVTHWMPLPTPPKEET